MLRGSLEDLDELILKCRNRKARDYIHEAVASYRAGAYRASVVTTWIAVCYDLIEKFRELALAGDQQAEQQAQIIDDIRRSGEIQKALAFERGILKFAQDKLELISPLEYVDLYRLQEDRNRCAHPSLTAEGEEYSPPAELARMHIHSAVNHLLMHEPAQGRYALDLIQDQIRSPYFPSKRADVLALLSSGPLKRARASLARNLTVVLLKDAFDPKKYTEFDYRRRINASLSAVCKLHSAQYDVSLSSHLPKLMSKVDDSFLYRGINNLIMIERSWQHLDHTQRVRLSGYVDNLPADDFDEIDSILSFAPLRAEALRRISRASAKEIGECVFFGMPTPVMDRLIDIYLKSRSYDEANKISRIICGNKTDLNENQIRIIVGGMAKNQEIMGSFELVATIDMMRKSKIIEANQFEALLRSYDLEAYAEDDDEVPF